MGLVCLGSLYHRYTAENESDCRQSGICELLKGVVAQPEQVSDAAESPIELLTLLCNILHRGRGRF